jgi:hypothetical protein
MTHKRLLKGMLTYPKKKNYICAKGSDDSGLTLANFVADVRTLSTNFYLF